MPKIYVSDFDENRLKQNFRNISSYVQDGYYKDFISPQSIAPSSGSSVVINNGLQSLQLPDAVTSLGSATIRIPELWVTGSIQVSLHWRSDSNAGDVKFGINSVSILEGTAPTTFTNFSTLTITVPAVANTIATDTFPNLLSGVSRSTSEALGLTIARGGNEAPDTCTGNVFILGLEVTFIPEVI